MSNLSLCERERERERERAAAPPCFEIQLLCFLRPQKLYFHGIADTGIELSFYALNEWKIRKKIERKKKKKEKENSQSIISMISSILLF